MSKVNIDKLKELQNYLIKLEPMQVYDIECKSIPQLYYELAKKINEIVNMLDIYGEHNFTTLEEILEEIDSLIDDNLIPELTKIMDDMYESGMLKELIEEHLLVELDELRRVANIAAAEDYYIPTNVESTILGTNGIPSEVTQENLEEFYNWKLNKLVDEFPTYAKRTLEGYDQSGVYPIYRYTFTPTNYDRTILLLGMTHGNEYTSFYSICNLLDKLCREYKEDNNLMFLREKVKIVCIPIVNPWGFVNSNRRNSRGVDLNRNSSYLWDEYTVSQSLIGNVYYKGDNPFSERETQIVKGVVEALLKDKLVGTIDMHTITTIEAEKILYYPRFADNICDKYHAIFEKMKTETSNDRRILATSTVPSISNWIAHQYKVIACNPEWCNAAWDIEGKRTEFNMTKHLEFMTNVILTVAKHNKMAQAIVEPKPFVKALVWDKSLHTAEEENTEYNSIKGHRMLNTTDNTPGTFSTSKLEFEVPSEGLCIMNGTVTVYAEQDCDVIVTPLLYQQYAPESNYSTQEVSDRNWQRVNLKANTYTVIPIMSTIQVYHSNYNDIDSKRSALVHARIKSCTSITSSAYITNVQYRVQYIPTTLGLSLEILQPTSEFVYNTIFPLRLDTYGYDD